MHVEGSLIAIDTISASITSHYSSTVLNESVDNYLSEHGPRLVKWLV